MTSNPQKKNSSSCLIAGILSVADRTQDATVSLSLLILLLSPAISTVGAQVTSPPPEDYNYARFSPSMAIIIVILVAALFFMGFFSIYIRRCSNDGGAGVRQALSMRRGRGVAASRGLDAAVIETFPTFPYATVKGLKIGKGALECAVCLNEFEDDETLRLIPKCDHVFHPECIDAWLENHVTCPVCRANLVPQPGESIHLPGESELETENTAELGTQQNGDVSIRISDDHEVNTNELEAPQPEVLNRNSSLRQNRPPRPQSVRSKSFRRFRSHSTGHSLIQPGENTDRYTLRLPEEVRKQVMNRAFLNRNASSVVMPRIGSSRRGYRTGTGEGSNRGRSYGRLESLRIGRSDRWIFARAPSFLTRAFSPRSPKVVADNGEASASSTAVTPKGSKMAAKLPFSSNEPKSDEIFLVTADSAQLPV